MSQLQLKAERDIVHALNSIKFKKMLLELDKDSRDVLFSKCVHWFLSHSYLDPESQRMFQWFQDVRFENSYLDEKEFRCSTLWGTLHNTLSGSSAFLKLVGLFL
jgi:hypothetical protein